MMQTFSMMQAPSSTLSQKKSVLPQNREENAVSQLHNFKGALVRIYNRMFTKSSGISAFTSPKTIMYSTTSSPSIPPLHQSIESLAVDDTTQMLPPALNMDTNVSSERILANYLHTY